MNRLARTILGLVATKAAIVAGWYLYEKSKENDWKAPSEPEVKPETTKTTVKVEEEVSTVKQDESKVVQKVDAREENVLEPQVIKSPKPKAKRVRKVSETEVKDTEKKPAAKKVVAKKTVSRKVSPKV